ncbi:MAG: corrinoid protein [Chloroflexi bacterium]|nr:corrinoid protein [Chloroflexota bacterium]
MPELVESIRQGVIEGRADVTSRFTQRALEEGMPPFDLYLNALIPAMGVVGARMQSGEYFIPEVLLSAKAMEAAAEVIKPALARTKDERYKGKVVLGTVEGDLHDIGKNLVRVMLQGAGFQVMDLGVDVPAERFVAAVKEVRPDILALSALLSITMVKMRDVVAALESAGCRDSVKVIVGGAVVSQAFADDIGADGYAIEAASAAELAKRLLEV